MSTHREIVPDHLRDQDQQWQFAQLRHRTDNTQGLHGTQVIPGTGTPRSVTPLASAPVGVDGMISMLNSLVGMGEPNEIQSWYDAKFGNPDGTANWPWCDATVTYAAWHSGNQAEVTFNGGYAYTVAHAQAFYSRGLWHPGKSGIQRGDIVFYDWQGGASISGIDHVETVVSTNSDGSFNTIGGNVSNQCLRLTRSGYVVGYGRPQYQSASPSPAPVPDPYPTSQLEPFPGASFFRSGQVSPIIKSMSTRLRANSCWSGNYLPDNNWNSTVQQSYSRWQRRLGYAGTDANGIPGKTSWDKLQVPKG